MNSQLNILTVYTSEDKEILQRILQHLKPLERDYNLTIWDDNPILKGHQWKPQNESRLEQVDIFLLLLSNSFMHSSFVQQLEFKMMIDSYKAGASKVIPVILEDCPWNIAFEADEYTFSFKELKVLPSDGKPVNDWNSSKKAYRNVGESIKSVIEPLLGVEASVKIEEKKETIAKLDEQTAIPFVDEKKLQQDKKRADEIEATKIAEVERLKKEAEAKSKSEIEQKIQEEKEVKIRAEKERKLQEEANKKAEEQKLRYQEKTKKINEEKRLNSEAELKRQAAKDSKLEEVNRRKIANKTNKELEEIEEEIGSGINKKVLVGVVLAGLVIIALWVLNIGSDDDSKTFPANKVAEVEDSNPIEEMEEAEVEIVTKKEALEELLVGDFHEKGMVFSIDSDNEKGIIVHLEDAGPMTWKNAMQIHEQLGEGWRVPTLEELKLLRKTLGPAANNNAEFSNGLYWSATSYDEYQARLLRFSDGNTTYHYNKEAEHRKYRVRAIRDFIR